MIYFLYGKDTYQSRQKLAEIIKRYKKIHKSGLNLKFFDFGKDTFSGLKEAVQVVSMFDEKKLFVLKNVFKNSDFQEKFKDFEKKLFLRKSEDIFVFFEEGVDQRKSLFKSLEKYAKVQEFKPLEQKGLNKWVKKEFERYKIKISPAAQDILIEFVGNDLWQMSNEIKKLVSYKWKQGENIEARDVGLLIKPRIEADIFKTIDAIASKNKKQALSLVHKHLQKGDAPLYILSMINFQFRNLLIVKERCPSMGDTRTIQVNSLGRELKIHPYVLRKTLWQTRGFSLGELKKIYRKIFQADLDIKTGKIEPIMALDLLIAEI